MADGPPLQRAVLELEADVTDPKGRDLGVFELAGNLEIQHGAEIQYFMVSGGGDVLSSVVSNTADELADFSEDLPTDAEPTNRAGFYLDLGGGQHNIELNFLGWEGATRPVHDDQGNVVDRENLQWGVPGDEDLDATGADPHTQMQVLMEFLRIGEYDSRGVHGKLRYGEYSDGKYGPRDGIFDDYINVTPTLVQTTRTAEQPVAFNGSIRLREVQNWTTVLDAIFKLDI
jgi:hypothetical protein